MTVSEALQIIQYNHLEQAARELISEEIPPMERVRDYFIEIPFLNNRRLPPKHLIRRAYCIAANTSDSSVLANMISTQARARIRNLNFGEIKRLKSGSVAESVLREIEPTNQDTSKRHLNIIYYGPPGTGKTHLLRQRFREFIVEKKEITREEYLKELISELTWWQTIAMALLQKKETSVPGLEQHEFIQIKAKQSTTKNLKSILWGQLLAHCDPDCEEVKFARRMPPYLFTKTKKPIWKILPDRVNDEAPEIKDLLSDIENYKPKTSTNQKHYHMVTFHQSFSYEDFVEGIKPAMEEEIEVGLQYNIVKGILYKSCVEAAKLAGYPNLEECINDSKENREEKIKKAAPFALFIDEINRANVSAVFGELITLIEEDKRLGNAQEITDTILPYSKDKFGVPANLHLVGTMNTADRSVEAMDTALRRRFTFQSVEPDPSLLDSYLQLQRLLLKHWDANMDDKNWQLEEAGFMQLSGMKKINEKAYQGIKNNFKGDSREDWMKKEAGEIFNNIVSFSGGLDLTTLLLSINERLEQLLSKDHLIGHSFFMQVFTAADLYQVFYNKIIPQLQEHFYGDFGKIGLVLGKEFVQTKNNTIRFADFEYDDKQTLLERKTYHINNFSDENQVDLDAFVEAVKSIA